MNWQYIFLFFSVFFLLVFINESGTVKSHLRRKRQQRPVKQVQPTVQQQKKMGQGSGPMIQVQQGGVGQPAMAQQMDSPATPPSNNVLFPTDAGDVAERHDNMLRNIYRNSGPPPPAIAPDFDQGKQDYADYVDEHEELPVLDQQPRVQTGERAATDDPDILIVKDHKHYETTQRKKPQSKSAVRVTNNYSNSATPAPRRRVPLQKNQNTLPNYTTNVLNRFQQQNQGQVRYGRAQILPKRMVIRNGQQYAVYNIIIPVEVLLVPGKRPVTTGFQHVNGAYNNSGHHVVNQRPRPRPQPIKHHVAIAHTQSPRTRVRPQPHQPQAVASQTLTPYDVVVDYKDVEARNRTEYQELQQERQKNRQKAQDEWNERLQNPADDDVQVEKG